MALARKGFHAHLIEAGPAIGPPPSPDVFSAVESHGLTGQVAMRTETQAPRPYVAGAGVGGSALVNGMLKMLPAFGALARSWNVPGWTANRFAESAARVFGDVSARRGSRSHMDGLLESLLPVREAHYFGHGTRPNWPEAVQNAGVRLSGGTTVKRVVLEAGQARGVSCDDGLLYESNEVVLCAGAIESPRLLWRSQVVLPAIGRHVLDHPSLTFTACPPAQPELSRYLAILSSESSRQDLLVTTYDARGLVVLTLLRTRSRGWLTATEIHLNQLSHTADRQALRSGVRQLGRVLPNATGADGRTLADLAAMSDDALDTWMRQNEDGTYHIAGSCRMGPTAIDNVVDGDGKVFGATGLFVADASIFPALPLASPQATVMIVADALATRW